MVVELTGVNFDDESVNIEKNQTLVIKDVSIMITPNSISESELMVCNTILNKWCFCVVQLKQTKHCVTVLKRFLY